MRLKFLGIVATNLILSKCVLKHLKSSFRYKTLNNSEKIIQPLNFHAPDLRTKLER